MIDTQAIRQRWESVGSKLDERGRRVFAAGEARAAGWGGVAALSEITGLARSTIGRGLKDLDAAPLPKGRERRKGGGRRHLSSRQSGWTAGGGIEYAFVPNWSIKLEYLHYGLGGVTFSGLTNSANLDIETVKVGVNYLFH